MMDFTNHDGVALLSFDDGKANAVSHAFIDAMNEGLDRAEAEANAVVIMGRAGRFSGGFDLSELKRGPEAATALVDRGAHMLLRLFSHPQPVIAACTGHAVAAGAFMLLACDTRIGTAGEFSIGLNETAIGMSLPVFGHELAKDRLSRRHLTASIVQAHLYDPAGAVDAGFLDETVAAEALQARALEVGQALGALPGQAYAQNKRDVRAGPIATIEASLR